jgi:arylsulfatase A-like enzyme
MAGFRHWWRRCCTAAVGGCLAVSIIGTAVAEGQPNIVYILASNLGWKDVGFHGGSIRTPNLDRLAASGAVLNALYAQPFSTQTRAALMTGRYPMRYGLQTMSLLPSSRFGLPVEERTLGQALKQVGYTTAFIGKWQLGHAQPEFWPTRRGFDYFYGTLTGQVDAAIKKSAKTDWRRNEQPLKEEGYVTQLLAKDAVKVMEPYRELPEAAQRNYAGAVAALDHAVGEVVAALERRHMLDNTLIVFQSDSGGAMPAKYPTGDGDVADFAADNGIYREGKGSLYEGGVRVVALISWAGKIKPGSTVVQFLHVSDMYPTILKLVGASLEQPKKLDGMDVWPVIAEGQLSPRKQVLINVEDFFGAIRIGEWKLIVYAALPTRVELFNVANDPEEQENVAGKYPERVKDMMTVLTDYAYDMVPSKYLEEVVAAEAGKRPLVWRHNPVAR